MKTEKKMTEYQFIKMFKRQGFELYRTRDLKKKLNALKKIGSIIQDLKY
jgi:hypothetical protein